MSRLIDADALIKHFETIQKQEDAIGLDFVAIIDEIKGQPTAYDVDKVVELLEDKLEELEDISKDMVLSEEQKRQNYGYRVAMSHAIEIVKGGGLDE